MATILAMFPGQGSQFVGMGKALLSEFPAAKITFEEAEDATKLALRRLCFEGPEEELKLTANTQPCILTVSVAIWRVLMNETALSPKYFAGHSLGEYSALVAADKIPLGRAAMLVRKRGEAMQAAVPAGTGAMAAVLSMPAADLVALCKKLSTEDSRVEVVNFNSPQQLVIAGHRKAVDLLCSAIEKIPEKSFRVVPLPVSAPFHSSLMDPARKAMELLLGETVLNRNDARVIPNLTGGFVDEYTTNLLVAQINSPVFWTQTLETADHAGCDTYLEIGPGKVLFGLARRCVPKTSKLLHTEDVKQAIKDVQGLS